MCCCGQEHRASMKPSVLHLSSEFQEVSKLSLVSRCCFREVPSPTIYGSGSGGSGQIWDKIPYYFQEEYFNIFLWKLTCFTCISIKYTQIFDDEIPIAVLAEFPPC